MMQQLLAVLVIGIIIFRLIWQRKNTQISNQEFKFWMIFWLFAGLAVVGLKAIDQLVADFGFSSTGIQVLLELAVVVLFYFIFRLRLRIARLERDITQIIESLAIHNTNNK